MKKSDGGRRTRKIDKNCRPRKSEEGDNLVAGKKKNMTGISQLTKKPKTDSEVRTLFL